MTAHRRLRENPQKALLLLIGSCALQSLIIALVHDYQLSQLRWIQPLTASLIPPLCWLAFISNARRPLNWRTDVLHAVLPVTTALSLIILPTALDSVVPLSFLIYAGKMLSATSQNGDSLPAIRLESGELPRHLWRTIAYALLASALCDGLIVLDQTTGTGDWLPIIVSLFSSANLLAIGALCLSQELNQTPGQSQVASAFNKENDAPTEAVEKLKPNTGDTVTTTENRIPPDSESEDWIDEEQILRDKDIMSQLSTLMNNRQLFLDADLTLIRLARKLGIPAKQVSAAINRQTGESVSRHVNSYRIDHACQLVLEGRSITQTVYDSGFNTKSNFNREFQRLKLASPSDWLATRSS